MPVMVKEILKFKKKGNRIKEWLDKKNEPNVDADPTPTAPPFGWDPNPPMDRAPDPWWRERREIEERRMRGEIPEDVYIRWMQELDWREREDKQRREREMEERMGVKHEPMWTATTGTVDPRLTKNY